MDLIARKITLFGYTHRMSGHLFFLLKVSLIAFIVFFCIYFILLKIIGKKKTSSFFLSLITIFLSTCIALVAAEYAVRIAYQDVTSTASSSDFFSRRFLSENPPIKNSLGYRDRHIPHKTPDKYRIAVIGDSFTYGQGINEEHRFTDLLQKKINAISNRFEIYNFGRSGTETDDHIEMLINDIIPTKPDFIILQWFINDVEIDNYERPQFLRLIPSDYLTTQLHKHSALYFLINQFWVQAQQKLGLGPKETYTEYLIKRFNNPDQEAGKKASNALEKFISITKQHNVSLGIVVFPELVEDMANYPLGFLLDRVLSQCDKQGLTCVDMRKYLDEISPSTKLWANRFDAHPGPLGNQITADTVFQAFSPSWKNN